jgi:hypothetical protein
MSDDELLDRGAACENRLEQIAAELAEMEPRLANVAPCLKRSTTKLCFNALLGVTGIALAPPTFGWSLLLTSASAAMLVWDSLDLRSDYSRDRPVRQRLRQLRREATGLADELEAINAVLDRRASGADEEV